MSVLIGGQTAPKAVHVGSNPILRQYVGDDLVWKKSRLPDGYQEVEWIKSNGRQYIDTTVNPSAMTKLWIDTSFDVISPELYGHGVFTDSRFVIYADNAGQWSFGAVGVYSIGSKDTDRHRFFIDNSTLSFGVEDIDLYGTFPQKSISDANIYLFARNKGTTIDWPTTNTMYSAKLFDMPNIIREFIPCYRKSDGVIGMYDLAGSICPLTGTPFYINSGAGAFTKGADI